MKIIAILTAAALGLTANASLAQSSMTVRFADLDVVSPAGKTVLAQRVGHAASTVCGVETGTTDLATHMAARTCRAHAIDSAMKAVALKTAPRYASR